MLMVPSSIRVFVATKPTDMRKSFNGLMAIVTEQLERDPLSGDLFLFRNRRGDLMKMLLWDRGGFWIFYKRLEKGTFKVPTDASGCAEINASDVALIIEGIDLAGARRRRRYVHPRLPESPAEET